MFRFYANENLSLALIKELRHFGHDVLTSYDAGNANQGIPDDCVLAEATANDRCVITFNRDDFLALHRSGVDHAGIVICKDDRDYLAQAKKLNDFLQQQHDLQNRLLRVQRQNQKGSSQPGFMIQEYPR